MADPIVIPGGGRTGETLLILGVLAGGAYFMWRKGAFARPEPLPTPAAAVPPPAPAPVPRPLIERSRQTLHGSHFSGALPPALPAKAPPAAAPPPPMVPAASPGVMVKPPPVTAAPSTVAHLVVNAPAPFGRKPIAKVITNAPAAKPAPIATPAPPPPKPTPTIAPTVPTSIFKPAAASSMLGGKFGGVLAKVR